MDENVDVIYVAPFQLDDEAIEYFIKLLQVRGIKNVTQRFHIIYPENYMLFDKSNISLSSLLLYSPKALKRIKMLTKGKIAYIIPGFVGPEDLKLAIV